METVFLQLEKKVITIAKCFFQDQGLVHKANDMPSNVDQCLSMLISSKFPVLLIIDTMLYRASRLTSRSH